MGYRNYIGLIPKKEYNKIKSLNRTQLYEYYNKNIDDDYIGVYDLCTILYGFGKYANFNPPKNSSKPFFKQKEIHNYYNGDNELFIVNKYFLLYIIDTYKERIKKYYNDMVTPFFGTKDTIFDKTEPSLFLNSIKTEYGKHTFDFSLITEEEQTALFKIFEHIRSMRIEWTCLSPINLDDNQNQITDSWKYEYNIFELVRIYKSFDWKRNILIYYGY